MSDHISILNNLPTIREKLEYCVNNKITPDTDNPFLRQLLYDLRDEVLDDQIYRDLAEQDYLYDNTMLRSYRDNTIARGLNPVPLYGHPEWMIDELGIVYNTRGDLAARRFAVTRGGYWIRPRPDKSLHLAEQVLLSHGIFPPDNDLENHRVFYRDGSLENCSLENLMWIRNETLEIMREDKRRANIDDSNL